MSIPNEVILGLLAGVVTLLMLRSLFMLLRPATVKAEPTRPVQADTPGIASHEKWKASLNAYKEGALTLEAFLDAWSGWVVLAPVKAIDNSMMDQRFPTTYQYKVTAVEAPDYSQARMNGVIQGIQVYGSHDPYGSLYTAKRKLGS